MQHEDYSGYNNRGVANAFIEKYEEAISDFSRVIELEPDKHSAYNSRGNIYCELKKYELAIKDYSKAIELAPISDKGYIYESRAKVYNLVKDTVKAKSDFENAKKFHNKNKK